MIAKFVEMKILNTLKNKYFITISFIIVWLFFFDKNDVFTQRELIKKCEKLQKEKGLKFQIFLSIKFNKTNRILYESS